MFRHNFFFFFLAFQLFSFGSTIISFPFPPRCYGSFPLSAIVVSAFNIFPAIEFLHCFVRVGENEIIFIVRVDRLIRLLCTEADNRNARTQTRDTVSVAYSPLFIPPLLDRREK